VITRVLLKVKFARCSECPVEDLAKLLGDTVAVEVLLDGLMHHAHLLECGPKSWRTRPRTDLQTAIQDAC